MNKAITEGLLLTPPAFSNVLDVWSRGDGTPGTATYQGYATAAFVPADQDFNGCLEVLKIEPTQRLRYMGETPLQPGCYLQIKARIKVISGNLPIVRIAGFAGDASGNPVPGVTLTGPSVALQSYGEIVEVSAIVGTGARSGVDMIWGGEAVYGHFGLDLSGPNGGVVRIDDLEITDVTGAFLRTMMDWVDVTDCGAIGDGVTDNVAAFEAADAQAAGRSILVPDGVYFMASNLTLDNPVRFQGTVTMPDNRYLALRRNFELDSYVAAFGDEVLAFKKAFQTLILTGDHDSLDLNGRSIALDAPIDMAATVPGKDTHTTRRVIRNGQFNARAGSGWDTGQVTSSARYQTSNPFNLTNVTNVANIEVGSLVSGTGVGREVYVRSRNIGAQTLELSNPLHDAAGTQSYTFKRYRYMLDFSGFEKISQFNIADIDFKCDGIASAVMISKDGIIWQFRDVFFNKPKDRGISSIGRACQGMQVDNCQFLSNEQPLPAQQRSSIAFNVNANDAKIRNNRAVRWGHWGVLNGSGHMIQGNHWFQGDEEQMATRQAGLVLTKTNSKIVITGNYIDNCFIEWNNEHDPDPEHSNELSFGALSITGNIFTASQVGPWFCWIVLKPYGSDHFMNGLSVSGNTFRALDGDIDRVDKLDDSVAPFDLSRTRNVNWTGNTYHGVSQWTASPVVLEFAESSPASTWSCDFSDWLPFGGELRNIASVVAKGPLRAGNNVIQYATPYTVAGQGASKGAVNLVWPTTLKGKVRVTGQVDNPA